MENEREGISRRSFIKGLGASLALGSISSFTTFAQNSSQLTVWTAPLGATQAENRYYNSMAKKFKEKTGTDVKVTSIPWSGIWQKYLAAASAKKLPDILWMPASWAIRLNQDGHLLPLSDTMNSIGGSDAFYNADWFFYQGEYWAIPVVRNPRICLYRKDLLEEVGYNHAPRTWEELEEVSKALMEQTNVYSATAFLFNSEVRTTDQHIFSFVVQGGGQILDKEGNVDFDSPGTREAYKFYTDLLFKGYNPRDSLGWTEESQFLDLIKAKQSAITFGMPGNAIALKNTLPQERFDKLGFAPFWKGPSGRSGSFGANDGWAVSNYSDTPELAKEFIRMVFEEDNLIEWFKAVSMLPPLKRMANNQELKEHFKEYKFYDAAIKQLPSVARFNYRYSKPTLAAADVEDNHVLADALNDIVLDDMPVGEAVKKAHGRIVKLYEKYRT